MPANTKEGAGTFHPDKKGAKWSRATRHPPHPTPGTKSGPIQKPSTAGLIIPKTSFRTAITTPELLGTALAGESWAHWRALLLAALGEPLKDDELALYQKLTERKAPPTKRVRELIGVIGRRGGKSKAIACLLVYLAALVDYRGKLTAGETAVCLCLSPSQVQSAIILNYARGILQESPVLRQLIVRETNETIELSNNVTIDVRSASFRRLRGQTCVAAVFDEIAFFHSDESANPDVEIIGAVKPSLMTTNGLLVAISSPYARKGYLWDTFRTNFGEGGDPLTLVARASSLEMNPSLDPDWVAKERARDPAGAVGEYDAEFRTDVESFVTGEALEDCTESGVRERPYNRMHTYSAFIDASAGAFDAYTMAISHLEGKTVVIDLIRETKPPFIPDAVTEQYCSILRGYQIYGVFGDRFGGEWVVDAYRKRGVTLEPSEKSKSELYVDLLPRINSRTIALLDDQTLRRQLTSLERKTRLGGKDVIDHVRGGRDDTANAVAGASYYAGRSLGDPRFWQPIVYSGNKSIV